MSKIAQILICGLLVCVLVVPAFAGNAPDGRPSSSKAVTVTKTIYHGGAAVADRAEGLFSGCLRTVFSVCNPCMDLVKGCTGFVMAPVEIPFAYLERTVAGSYGKGPAKRPVAKKPVTVPAPEKPELPQK